VLPPPQLLHRNSCTATPAPQLLYSNSCTATPAPQLLHRDVYYTATPNPQHLLLHCNSCTTTAAHSAVLTTASAPHCGWAIYRTDASDLGEDYNMLFDQASKL